METIYLVVSFLGGDGMIVHAAFKEKADADEYAEINTLEERQLTVYDEKLFASVEEADDYYEGKL